MLEIAGDPGGTIYVRNGRLTFAESPAVPDLRARLLSSQRVSAQQWRQLTEAGGARGSIGALLVGRGLLTRPELQVLLRSMVLDALLALTVPRLKEPPLAKEPTVTRARFTMGRSHWAEAVLSLEVRAVLAELERKAGQLAWHNVPAGSRPRLPRRTPGATLPTSMRGEAGVAREPVARPPDPELLRQVLSGLRRMA